MRLNELDSLRGVAALTVLINHFTGVYIWAVQDTYDEGITGLNLLKYTPLHVLWYGHEAVIMFFVLSGFVLSLPFFGKEVKYVTFLVKRVCRIYLPYLAALIFSLLCFSMFSHAQQIPYLSYWFNGYWKSSLNIGDIVNYFLLIGYFDSSKINGPFWTLVHEMRISIIFPFIVSILILKRSWKTSLLVGILLSLLSWVCSRYIFLGDFFETIQYIFIFIIGGVLAKYYKILLNKYISLNRFKKTCVILIGIMSLSYTWLFYGQKFLHKALINDWMIAFGASIIIIVVMAHNKFLLLRPIKFLGNISYSLYLLHLPILLSVIHINNGSLPTWLNLLISFMLTLVLSNIFYLYIEKPSIKLGKRIVSRISSRNYSEPL